MIKNIMTIFSHPAFSFGEQMHGVIYQAKEHAMEGVGGNRQKLT